VRDGRKTVEKEAREVRDGRKTREVRR